MQLIRTRSLEAKVAAIPTDDLLSRAEWLLKEKDKAAITLEQAAKLLAEAEAAAVERDAMAVEAEQQAEPEAAAPEQAEPSVVAAPETPEMPVAGAPVEPEQAEPALESIEQQVVEPAFGELVFQELDFEPEDGEAVVDGSGKPVARKKSAKGRELVYDDRLGQVVSRKKRKPTRSGWVEDAEEY